MQAQESLSNEQLLEVQKAIFAVCKDSKVFAEKVLKDGFKYHIIGEYEVDDDVKYEDVVDTRTDEEKCVRNMPSGIVDDDGYGINYEIANIIVYDISVMKTILDSCSTYDNKSSDEVIIQTFVKGVDFNECVPNLVKPIYNWSKPVNSKELGYLLREALSYEKNGFDGSGNFDMSVTHIHMVNGDMVWDTYSDEDKSTSIVGGHSSINNHIGYAEKLVKVISKMGKPIKEIYVLKGADDYMRGEFIARKHSDGEYTLTVY